ncbi:MAG: protein tyrosine phosphatase family protein [Anaerolineae bacterium]
MDEALTSIRNYLRIGERLLTAGQPTSSQFTCLAAADVEVVINLAMPDSSEAVIDEDRRVAGLGLTYVHIPVPWDAPTIRSVARFFELMAALGCEKAFVHCIMNMRISVFVFLYRVCRQGVSVSDARADLLRIWHPNQVWQRLIDDVMAEPEMCPCLASGVTRLKHSGLT